MDFLDLISMESVALIFSDYDNDSDASWNVIREKLNNLQLQQAHLSLRALCTCGSVACSKLQI